MPKAKFTYEEDGQQKTATTSYRVYDNGGKSLDRYTILFTHRLFSIEGNVMYLGCSETGRDISMWGEIPRMRSYKHLGKLVKRVPIQLRKHIEARLSN